MSKVVEFGIKINIDGNKAAADGIESVSGATVKMGQAADEASHKVAASHRELASATAALAGGQLSGASAGINQVRNATDHLGEATIDFSRKVGNSQKTLASATAELASGQAKLQAGAQAVHAASSALDSVGFSAKQTEAALRNVPAQFTDIVTSIQAGQSPLTVLLQQGGQLRDMFGSSGAAARALGRYVLSLINPYTIAAGAAAALALAYNQGSKEADAYNRAIILSGNVSGTTAGKLGDMARAISESVGTQGDAAEALAAIVGTGQVASQEMEQFALVAVRMERTIGQSVADTAKVFADLGEAPVEASEKLNEQYRYLNSSTYERIKALAEQGRMEEAAAAAQGAYATAFDERTRALLNSQGAIERAWNSVKDAAKWAWDGMLNIGRSDSLEKQLSEVQAKIKRAQAPFDPSIGGNAEARAKLKDYQALEASLKEQVKSEKEKARAQAEGSKLSAAQVTWSKEGEKYQSRALQLEKEIEVARQQGAKAQVSATEIEKRIGDIRKKYTDIFNGGIDAQIEAVKRRGQVEESLTKRALDGLAASRAAGLIVEQDYIEKTAQLELGAFDKRVANLSQELALTKGKQNSLKEQAALDGALALATEERKSREIALTNALFTLDVQRTRAAAENYANVVDRAAGERDSLRDQVQAQLDYNSAIGRTSVELVDLTSSRIEELAARKEADADVAEGVDLSGALADKYRDQAQALRELAAARRAGAAADAAFRLDDRMWRDAENSARDMAHTMEDAFGSVGNAIGRMTFALVDYQKTQRDIQRDLERNKTGANGGKTKILEAEAKASRESAHAQIRQYGDMTQAASGFFAQGSKGYKALHAAEQAFRVFELAMTMQSMAKKLMAIGTVTTATVGAEATKSAAVASGTAVEVAANMVKGTSAAAVGVATQASGDPWTAWARMAAMAAVMAGLGFAVGGVGGGPDMAQQTQEAAGTGTVLGDAAGKSESITRSIESMERNSGIELTHTAGMLASLRNIESSMTGLGNLVVRSLDIDAPTVSATLGFDPAGVGKAVHALIGGSGAVANLSSKIPVVGEMLGGLMNKVGSFISKGFGTKTALKDNGIYVAPQSLGSVQADGLSASAYAAVEKTKKFLWVSYSKTVETEFSGLSSEITSQLGLVIKNLASGTQMAAELLGISGDEFTRSMQGFVVDIGKISLKGLTGEEIQAQFETIFSAMSDKMARQAMPMLDQFQRVGEGYFETLTRVAANYANLDAIMASTGSTFGAVGVSSLAARERFIELAGGIDKLAGQVNAFAQNYLTEAERMAPVATAVQTAMASLGLASVTTREQFKAVVLGLDVTTEAGAKQYAALMDLQEAFAQVHPVLLDTADAATDAADALTDVREILAQRKTLQDELDQLTMTSTQLLAKQRNGYHETNRALFDQIQAAKAAKTAAQAAERAASEAMAAAQAAVSKLIATLSSNVDAARTGLSDAYRVEMDAINRGEEERVRAVEAAHNVLAQAYERENDALHGTVSTLAGFARSIREFRDSLVTGELSILSPEAKYEELRHQFDRTYSLALAGDTNAMGGLQAIAQQFLESSRAYNGSGTGYVADFERVRAVLDSSANSALVQVDVARQQLDELARQVSGIQAVNQGVVSLRDAILNQEAAQRALEAYNAEGQRQLLNRQVDGLVTINQSVLSVRDAISQLTTAQAQLAAAQAQAAAQSAASQASADSTRIAARDATVAFSSGDTPMVAAAKVLYAAATGGVSTEMFNRYVGAVGGPEKVTGWSGDPEALRAFHHFAEGGIFTNGVVSQPTNFDIGEMGEAGPEAIVPLIRTSGGLGVRATQGDSRETVTELKEVKALLQAILNKGDSGHAVVGAIDRLSRRVATLEDQLRLARA